MRPRAATWRAGATRRKGGRRGAAAVALLPSGALAEVCAERRPDWNGAPATQLDHALALFLSPIGLFLLAALAVALVARHAMGTALVALLWSFWISWLILPDDSGMRATMRTEGCIASPTLFIALSTAICAASVTYTMRREKRL